MANLQELTIDQINEAIGGAAEKLVPLTVTVHDPEGWVNLYSRLLGFDGQHILIARPSSDQAGPREFQPADRIGGSFKYRHHKHIFSATVATTLRYITEDGEEVDAVSVIGPSRMQRLQRRIFQRVAVPTGAVVRGAFWLGGVELEPTGQGGASAVWTGAVSNISAGGFQLVCQDLSAPKLHAGDTVGVRLMFGIGEETCFADAQFRHAETEGDTAILGFQFVGLAHSSKGRSALQKLSAKVTEFQRAEQQGSRRRHAS
ncbi:MAG: flagellar brake protein [Planctomycetota bacterium]|jgi:c-di-GMP-binding flagellar brake protein YcgR